MGASGGRERKGDRGEREREREVFIRAARKPSAPNCSLVPSNFLSAGTREIKTLARLCISLRSYDDQGPGWKFNSFWSELALQCVDCHNQTYLLNGGPNSRLKLFPKVVC